MRIHRIMGVVVVLGLAGQIAFAVDPMSATVPPEVLLQFEGRTLPPMEELAASGLIPGRYADAKSLVSEMGYITQWLSHNDMLIGTLDDDLVGEADIVPICYADQLTDHDDAPRMYRSYWTYPQIWTSHYNAFEDREACETVYIDQVRYFLTQVKSPSNQNATLLVGADEGIKVWLNGVEVMRHEDGEYEEDQYDTPVQLQQGWNLVLVKVYYPLIGPEDHPDYEQKRWSLRFVSAEKPDPLHLPQNLDGWCDHEQSYQWIYAGGAADLAGAQGSQWASDLRLTNPYHFPLELTVQYFEEGHVGPTALKATETVLNGAEPDAERVVVLDPFESRVYRQVLTSFLGVTPPQKGMIAIRGYYYWDAQYNGTVELRTYNRSGAGTFGTVIPMTYLYSGYTCCAQTLHGLRNGPGFRTNIGMAPRRVLDSEVEFTITIWDSVTGAFAQKAYVGSGSFQLNDIFAKLGLGGVTTDTAIAYIQWSSNSTGAYYRFFASVVDNHTSDPVDVGPGYYLYPPPLQ